MWVHRCIREEKEVRGVAVQQCDHIGQRGTIIARFLGVIGEEFQPYPRGGGGWRVSGRRVLFR